MHIVFRVVGLVMIGNGIIMLIPVLFDHRFVQTYLFSSFFAFFLGGGLFLSSMGAFRGNLKSKHTFLITAGSWVAVCLISSIPFRLHGIAWENAIFESVSGLTTTGSTVLSGLDTLPRSLLVWRSLLQWIGGIGIIVTSIAILPILRIGGMQLYRTESSDTADKALAGATQVAGATLIAYIILTCLCMALYATAGMSGFDAFNHSLTTVATGGFSTHDASMGYFQSKTILWIGTVFMISGAIPFIIYINFFRGNFLLGEQIKLFLTIIIVLIIIISTKLFFLGEEITLLLSSHVAFNVVSIITTTGYASTDYTSWGDSFSVIFFLLTFSGACTGSTSGGIKLMRFIVGARIAYSQVSRLIYPSGVFHATYERRRISHDIVYSVGMYFFIFISSMAVLTVLLGLLGLDFVTSLSGAATALANVGPGIGEVIGPSGNFASLNAGAKYILSVGMLLGRLEFLTLLVLFHPMFWKS